MHVHVAASVCACACVRAYSDRLEINWIKAHAGHNGNELADKMAREAAQQIENTHGLFPPYSHFKQDGKLCTAIGRWNSKQILLADYPKNFSQNQIKTNQNKSYVYPGDRCVDF